MPDKARCVAGVKKQRTKERTNKKKKQKDTKDTGTIWNQEQEPTRKHRKKQIPKQNSERKTEIKNESRTYGKDSKKRNRTTIQETKIIGCAPVDMSWGVKRIATRELP